jgi:N-acetylglucosamine-6-phosphate deacetylase
LAGSILKLNEAVRNYHTHTEATLVEAVASVTTLPAEKLGLSTGLLKSGYDADIVIFDDEVNLQSVYIDGALKWNKKFMYNTSRKRI